MAFHYAIVDMRNLGVLCFYLGIEVRQDASDISLRQTHYAKCILELGRLDCYNPAYSLMEKELKLSRQSTAKEVDPTLGWT